MSGLFKILFELKIHTYNDPLEDYLTELFAYCLNDDQDLLYDFLQHFKIISSDILDYNVHTQVELSKLEGHKTNSRPDIAIYGDDHIIFFENKVDYGEGHNQLKRYAEHLDIVEKGHKCLVYITKHYDAKDKEQIFKNCRANIGFIALRWHQVFEFLKCYKSIQIVAELLVFMKQKNLDMNNQFSPADILALTNFSNVNKIIDETMYGMVSDRFKEINLAISDGYTPAYTQLRKHDRYTYMAYHPYNFVVFLGYWMNTDNEKRYPDIGVYIEIAPSSEKREEVVQIFKEILKHYDSWEDSRLNDPTRHAGIKALKSLQDFLSLENQVEEIQKYFLGWLDDLEMFFKMYQGLPRRA